MEVSGKGHKFLWLGNWPALDFVNTQIVQDGETVDLLATGADLADWYARSALASQVDLSAARSYAALSSARTFRDELRAILGQLDENGKVLPKLLASLNTRLQRRNVDFVVQNKKGRYVLTPEWTFKAPEDVCSPIAFSFAELLSQTDLSRIRRCKNPACVLFFYDTSRSGTRSWCSLNICGNKQRVAAFRERQSQA